jgi:hypothetical protein
MVCIGKFLMIQLNLFDFVLPYLFWGSLSNTIFLFFKNFGPLFYVFFLLLWSRFGMILEWFWVFQTLSYLKGSRFSRGGVN